VADFIFAFLAARGVRDVFLVTGGGAMFLDDALRRQDASGRGAAITNSCGDGSRSCMHRIAGLPGVVCVTTGQVASTP